METRLDNSVPYWVRTNENEWKKRGFRCHQKGLFEWKFNWLKMDTSQSVSNVFVSMFEYSKCVTILFSLCTFFCWQSVRMCVAIIQKSIDSWVCRLLFNIIYIKGIDIILYREQIHWELKNSKGTRLTMLHWQYANQFTITFIVYDMFKYNLVVPSFKSTTRLVYLHILFKMYAKNFSFKFRRVASQLLCHKYIRTWCCSWSISFKNVFIQII